MKIKIYDPLQTNNQLHILLLRMRVSCSLKLYPYECGVTTSFGDLAIIGIFYKSCDFLQFPMLSGPECGGNNWSLCYINNWKYKHTFIQFEEGHTISTSWRLLKTIVQWLFYLASGIFLVTGRNETDCWIMLIASKPVTNRVPAILWSLIREALFCTLLTILMSPV